VSCNAKQYFILLLLQTNPPVPAPPLAEGVPWWLEGAWSVHNWAESIQSESPLRSAQTREEYTWMFILNQFPNIVIFSAENMLYFAARFFLKFLHFFLSDSSISRNTIHIVSKNIKIKAFCLKFYKSAIYYVLLFTSLLKMQ
jgi:hypothetical protein